MKRLIKYCKNYCLFFMNVYWILESNYTEKFGDPVIFQVYYIKAKNPANYALGVALSISKSLSGGSSSLIYNIMNITTTRINPSGCVNGTRRRRRSTADLLKYVYYNIITTKPIIKINRL